MDRKIAFDTETTGLSFKNGDRIVELAFIELFDDLHKGKSLHLYVNPEIMMSQKIMEIHGITNEFLFDKPLFKNVAKEILDFIKNDPLIAHNASFDMRFLNAELEHAGYSFLTNKVIDTLVLAKQRFPDKKNTLDALCSRFNVDLSKRVTHGSLIDTELLIDVYGSLLGKRATKKFELNWFKGAKDKAVLRDYNSLQKHEPRKLF